MSAAHPPFPDPLPIHPPSPPFSPQPPRRPRRPLSPPLGQCPPDSLAPATPTAQGCLFLVVLLAVDVDLLLLHCPTSRRSSLRWSLYTLSSSASPQVPPPVLPGCCAWRCQRCLHPLAGRWHHELPPCGNLTFLSTWLLGSYNVPPLAGFGHKMLITIATPPPSRPFKHRRAVPPNGAIPRPRPAPLGTAQVSAGRPRTVDAAG